MALATVQLHLDYQKVLDENERLEAHVVEVEAERNFNARRIDQLETQWHGALVILGALIVASGGVAHITKQELENGYTFTMETDPVTGAARIGAKKQ